MFSINSTLFTASKLVPGLKNAQLRLLFEVVSCSKLCPLTVAGIYLEFITEQWYLFASVQKKVHLRP